jgi:hypothetical protein
MDELGAARGPADQDLILNRIRHIYVVLVRLYYQFTAASTPDRTVRLWNALNLWPRTFDLEPIEQTYIDYNPRPPVPKPFSSDDE